MTIFLNNNISFKNFIDIVSKKSKVEFDEKSIENVNKAAEFIQNANNNNVKIYGVNTGLGSNYSYDVKNEHLISEYQKNILRSHAVSVGEPFKEDQVRAIILGIILNGLTGYSGVTINTLNFYKEMLNRNLYPYVPMHGSVGYLAQEAHIGLAAIGEGFFIENGKKTNAREVIEKNGLKPLTLTYKEALFLSSGAACVIGLGTLALSKAINSFYNSNIIATLNLDLNGCNPGAFSKELMEVRKQYGQNKVGDFIRILLADSSLMSEDNLQDPLSLRAIPQLHGAVYDFLVYVTDIISRELKSSTDNPIIVDTSEGFTAISGCNCDSSYIGLSMETVNMAMTMLGKISERRTFRLLDEKLSGFPAYLINDKGFNSGFMITQYTQAGLLNEMKILSTPAIIDSIPTSANQEDYVAMGYNSVLKIFDNIKFLDYILAIELITVNQAFEFINKEKSASKVKELVNTVRMDLPYINNDVYLGEYIEKGLEIIENGRLLEVVKDIINFELFERF